MSTCTISKKSTDAVILGLALLLPLTYLWVPFYHDTYGIYATSCWIQNKDENCSKSTGSSDQIVCTGILRASTIIVIVTILILLVIFCRTSAHFKQIQSRQMRRKIKQTLLLMVFFLSSFIVEASGLAMNIYSSVTRKDINNYTILVIYDIAMLLSQLIIPISLLVYLYSFKRQSLNKALKEWRECFRIDLLSCRFKSAHNDSLLHNSDPNDDACSTAPGPKNHSIPSCTYFDVEYTGEFTKITDTKNSVKAYGSISTKDSCVSLSKTSSSPNSDLVQDNREHVFKCEGSGAGIYSDAAQMYTEQNSRENTREKINFSASPDHDTSKSIEVRDFA